MFGIIYGTLLAVSAIKEGIVNAIDNVGNRNKFRNNITNTYIDHNGVFRDLNTNKPVGIYHKNHDLIVVDNKGNRKNVSQEMRDKEFMALKNNRPKDRTVYAIYGDIRKNISGCFYAFLYQDLITDEFVFCRHYFHKQYYIRLSDFKVLRYSDGQKYIEKENNTYNNKEEKAGIKEFQKEIDKNISLYGTSFDPTNGDPNEMDLLELFMSRETPKGGYDGRAYRT